MAIFRLNEQTQLSIFVLYRDSRFAAPSILCLYKKKGSQKEKAQTKIMFVIVDKISVNVFFYLAYNLI